MVNLLSNITEQIEVRTAVLCFPDTEEQEIPVLNEEWLNGYIAHEFTQNFQMKHETFKTLLHEMLRNTNNAEVKAGTLIIPMEKCLLICVWYFVKNEALMSIGERFDVDAMTVYDAITVILHGLKLLLPQLIRWPSKDECEDIAEQFHIHGGYPDTIGAVDICHITYNVPVKLNERIKIHHAITLQGICTTSRMFTSVSVGWPGSIHNKSKILQESRIGYNIENHGHNNYFYGNKYHLIGDSMYPLKVWLMTPYKNSDQLTNVEKLHNKILERTREVTDETFKLLKCRWNILQNINTYSIERAAGIIVGCCILHNFCILHKDFLALEEDFQ